MEHVSSGRTTDDVKLSLALASNAASNNFFVEMPQVSLAPLLSTLTPTP